MNKSRNLKLYTMHVNFRRPDAVRLDFYKNKESLWSWSSEGFLVESVYLAGPGSQGSKSYDENIRRKYFYDGSIGKNNFRYCSRLKNGSFKDNGVNISQIMLTTIKIVTSITCRIYDRDWPWTALEYVSERKKVYRLLYNIVDISSIIPNFGVPHLSMSHRLCEISYVTYLLK